MGDQVTCLDCKNFEDGGVLFGFGTLSGKIKLRIDWEEIPQQYNINYKITDIKFS